jgi:hypothetical protein
MVGDPMRKILPLAFSGIALLGIALLGARSLLVGDATTRTPAQISADFVLATCLANIDDLSAVDRLGKSQSWISMMDADPPQPNSPQVTSMWRVSQNGRTYTVTTGSGPKPDDRACLVMFEDVRPDRAGFYQAISAALTITRLTDLAMSVGRHEMHAIDGKSPNKLVLQTMTMHDDTLLQASIMSSP